MKKIANIFRVICNRIRFTWYKVLGVRIHNRGICTSRLSTEFAFSKNSRINIGSHFTSMQNCRILVRRGGYSR